MIKIDPSILSKTVKAITPKTEKVEEAQIRGTIVFRDNEQFVQLDGAPDSALTPISDVAEGASDAGFVNGDRVLVLLKNHQAIVTKNLTVGLQAQAAKEAGSFVTIITDEGITAQRIIANDTFTNTLRANNIKADDIIAGMATIDTLDANYAHITNGVIDNAKIGVADVNDLSANYAHITQGVIDNAKIDQADVNNLSTNYAHVTNGVIDTATIDQAKVNNLSANYAHISNGVIDNAKIDQADVNNLSANYAHVTNGVIDNAKIGHADVNGLNANYAHITNGAIDNAEIDYADVKNLNAHYAEIDLANVNNAWIQNGVVKDAAITDAQILGVSANKLTAGTIDASNITVTNLNASNITTGSITVDGITIDVENNEASIDGEYIEDGTITMNGLAQEVKDVIDGAIETYTGTVVPTLNNAPANAWTTTKLKDQHIGDVYYVVNSSSQQNGYCYRFSKSGSTYSWQLIKDSDVTAALQRLQTAEGKISNIESFDEEMATFKTETEGDISTLQTKTTSLETSLGDKVDKTTFNAVKQTVDGNSASITSLSTITTNNELTASTNITNTVNSVSQTANGNSSKISSLTTTLGTNADGTTKAGDIVHRASDIEQDLDGFKVTVAETYVQASDSKSGSIVTWENMLIDDLDVDIEPIQDLNGYDKPWSGGAGKNKLPYPYYDTSKTHNGVTWTVNADGTITANGTATSESQFLLTTSVSGDDYVGKILTALTSSAGSPWKKRALIQLYGSPWTTLDADYGSGVTVPNTASGVNIRFLLCVASGATVTNEVFKPMIRLASETDATYEPYSNICPISGYDSVVVSRCGKNLFEGLTSGTRTNSGITWTYNADGTVTATGTATGNSWSYGTAPTVTLPKGTYTVSVTPPFGLVITKLISGGGYFYNGDNSEYTFTLTEPMKICIYARVKNGTTINATTGIQLSVGSSKTAFEPYQGNTYTINLNGTRYGGTLNVTSGVLTVTHGYVDLGTLTWTADGSSFPSGTFHANISGGATASNPPKDAVCSQYAPYIGGVSRFTDGSFSYANSSLSSSAGRVFIHDSTYAGSTAAQFKTAMSGVQFVYELATPTTVELTTQEVSALVGTNVLWANSGDVHVELTGVKDYIDAIASLEVSNGAIVERVAATEEGLGSAQTEISQKIEKVEGAAGIDLVSNINAVADQITLSADRINFTSTGTVKDALDNLNSAISINTQIPSVRIGNAKDFHIEIGDWYKLTEDEAIDVNKTYYTRSGTVSSYVYTEVENPVVADIGTYYEKMPPQIGFYQGEVKVAYMNGSELYVENSLSFGKFAFIQRQNNHFTLKLID